jgi:hypothetical protein
MNKIIFEFSETVLVLDDITITVEATSTEVLFAAATLINVLVDGMRKETEMSKGEAEERVLTMIRKALGTE